jgi:hypothetical protein
MHAFRRNILSPFSGMKKEGMKFLAFYEARRNTDVFEE